MMYIIYMGRAGCQAENPKNGGHMCDRECKNCLKRRTCEWQDGGARIGGCMEFTPDMAIPEVAKAEQTDKA